MTILHDIWLIAGVIEAVIGTLEVIEKGQLTVRELFIWRLPRVLLAPFALMARLFEGIRNFERTGNLLWQDKQRAEEMDNTPMEKKEHRERLETEFDETVL